MDDDQKAFQAAILSGFERQGVIGPMWIAGDRGAVDECAGLAEGSVVDVPCAGTDAPPVGALGEIALVKDGTRGGSNFDVFVFDIGAP